MLAGLAGGLGIKAIVITIVVVAIGGIITAASLHYRGLLKDNAELKKTVAVQETALAAERQINDDLQEAIDLWELRMEELEGMIAEVQDVATEARAEQRRLVQIFGEHDVEKLARKKPGLIANRFNAGTANLHRMLECETGGGSDVDCGREATAAGAPGS